MLDKLLKKPGAGINEAVCGAAVGNRKELLDELLKGTGADINIALAGAVKGNHEALRIYLLNLRKDLFSPLTAGDRSAFLALNNLGKSSLSVESNDASYSSSKLKK